MKVRSQTRLARRGAIYYFRAKIPVDLKFHFGSKREIIESLKTSNRKEAEELVRVRSVELDQQFSELRRQRDTAPRETITEAEIKRIVSKAIATRMKADEEARVLGVSEADYERHLKWLEESEKKSADAVARGSIAPLEALTDDWLINHGFALAKDSEGYRKFAYEFAKAHARVNQQLRARDRGEPVDTPPMPLEEPLHGHESGSLDALCEYWKQQKKPRSKTIIEANSVVRRFRALHGDIAPPKVTRRHVMAFRDALVEEGKAPGTIKKLFALLSSMFQIAVEDDGRFGIETNPVRDVKVRGRVGEVKVRKPFSPEDLKAIFSSSVFTQGARPVGGAGEAAYWLPLLGLFTGARLNEIGQLRVADVKSEDGVTFLHFTNEGEGQHLKRGRKSRKRVPIHPELQRLGLLRYVEAMRAGKRDRLFPDLNGTERVTAAWSKWWSRYLDGVVGITDPGKDFHAFRHTFKLASRSCGIPEDQHDALTGHANASVSRAYGSAEGYPIGQLAKAMKRLRYAGLDLSGLRRGAESAQPFRTSAARVKVAAKVA
jgi:integrase